MVLVVVASEGPDSSAEDGRDKGLDRLVELASGGEVHFHFLRLLLLRRRLLLFFFFFFSFHTK